MKKITKQIFKELTNLVIPFEDAIYFKEEDKFYILINCANIFKNENEELLYVFENKNNTLNCIEREKNIYLINVQLLVPNRFHTQKVLNELKNERTFSDNITSKKGEAYTVITRYDGKNVYKLYLKGNEILCDVKNICVVSVNKYNDKKYITLFPKKVFRKNE